ncbi:MAG TPA: Sec-independent protein translocase protein TatB [Casimicrobiaceae bacterium]|jgi:sec-independent protein translocase protein TatB|nr:Sec-independent protein translocase protein TatB [Casimicrobiaceae bacterium]
MFDVGFSEIVLIAVVALIVIGPEKLPKVARTLGHMFGRLQRYVNEVKADINREIELDELRKLQTQVQDAARDMEQSMTDAAHQVESGLRSVEEQLNAAEAANAAPEAKLSAPSAASTAAPEETGKGEPSRQASLPGFDRQ